VRKRTRASFERQGLMAHLGARLTHIAPGRVHIVLTACQPWLRREAAPWAPEAYHEAVLASVAELSSGTSLVRASKTGRGIRCDAR
jgi:acyl-coenzyme A thioesterase PaaI-like protein